MKKIRFYLISIFFFCWSSNLLAQWPQVKVKQYTAKEAKCIKATKNWLFNYNPDKTREENLNQLIKLTAKYPNCPFLLSKIQQQLKKEVNKQDWFRRSIQYGYQVLDIDPTYPLAHMYLGESWRYVGEYELAIKHFQPLVNFYDIGEWADEIWPEYAEDDIITYRFLAKNSGANYLPANLTYLEALSKVDFSNKVIQEKSGIIFLKELVINVGSLFVKDSIKEFDPYILLSLDYLDEWITSPNIISSSKYRFGWVLKNIVDCICTIITENNLQKQLIKIYEINRMPVPIDWPQANFNTGTNSFKDDANKKYQKGTLKNDISIINRLNTLKSTNIQPSNKISTSPVTLKDSLTYYQKILESDSMNIKAIWGFASLLEYIGKYSEATEQYQLVIDNTDDLKQKANARVHMITCEYLESNAYKTPTNNQIPDDPKPENYSIDQEHQQVEINGNKVDVSPQAIAQRSGWTYIKGLATSIAVAGSVAGLGGDSQYVQYALTLLNQWIESPAEQSVQARNEFLAGMISTLASIITKHDLTFHQDMYNPKTSNIPEAGYAGDMQPQFEQMNFDEIDLQEKEKTIHLTDEVMVTEIGGSIDISGEYDCIYPPDVTTGSRTITTSDGHTSTITIYPLIVSQNDNILNLQSISTNVSEPSIDKYSSWSGSTLKSESIGKGKLIENKADIQWSSTITQSGSWVKIGSSIHNNPPTNSNSQSSSTLRILANGDIEFTSIGSDGIKYTSKHRKR